jgi:hypothetical protein
MGTGAQEVLDAIFAGLVSSLYDEFSDWVTTSRRFRAFAFEHRVKIRSKIRAATSEMSASDLVAELSVARLLLADRRFELAYEKYAAVGGRSPDFTATFRENTLLNVEVRRIQPAGSGPEMLTGAKLTRLLADKAGQTRAREHNVVWLWCDMPLAADTTQEIVARLHKQALANHKTAREAEGHANTARFVNSYGQISAVMVHPGGSYLVENTAAQLSLGPELARALRALVQ